MAIQRIQKDRNADEPLMPYGGNFYDGPLFQKILHDGYNALRDEIHIVDAIVCVIHLVLEFEWHRLEMRAHLAQFIRRESCEEPILFLPLLAISKPSLRRLMYAAIHRGCPAP